MQTPSMRKPILQRPGVKSDSRNACLNCTPNVIWAGLLLFSAVAFLNFVYITEYVLVTAGENEGVWSSFAVSTSFDGFEFVDEKAPDDSEADKINTSEPLSGQEQDTRNSGDKNNPMNIRLDQNATSSDKNLDENTTNHYLLVVPETSNKTTKTDAKPEEVSEIEYTPRHIPRKRRRKRDKNRDENRTLTPEEKLKYTFEESAMMPNVSNAIYYKDIPHEFLVEDPSVFLWDRAEAMIPEWMKDYFRWHRWKRSTWKDQKPLAKNSNINNTNDDWWKTERWLISQCLMISDQKKCGGTADRLKPIPELLRIAYENKRVYLIRWTRPAPLESFLMPPTGGFDWRVPPELAEIIDDDSNGKRLTTIRQLLKYSLSGMSLVRSRYQTSNTHIHYNDMVLNNTSYEAGTESDKEKFGFDAVFSRMWRVFFTPSPPIQAIIRSKLSELGLVPNDYAATHLRALYAVKERDKKDIHVFTENALACATMIYPGVPIFFASDAAIALEHAEVFNGKEVSGVVGGDARSIKLKVSTTVDAVTTPNLPGSGESEKNASAATTISQPWHLDSFQGPVENFYHTFVDLYLLAMAGCVTYSKGGFGNWAMVIGGHTHCEKRQHYVVSSVKIKKNEMCHFQATNESFENVTTSFNKRHPSVFGKDDLETGPIFLPPMN